MFSILLHDTFIQELYNITKQLDSSISLSYLFGRTGHGARLSIAMNTKTGKEIGHPSGHFSWDIVGVVENCFPDVGIDCTLYIGPGYATRARSTAAQSDRKLSSNVVLLDDYEFSVELTGQILYPDDSGIWHSTNSSSDIDVNWELLPFGPVIIQIHSFTKQSGFPSSTFRYLVDTLERGEEPMEIRGRNNYSTVSGWKAYARWMQSYSVPLPEVKHDHLSIQPALLIERRNYFLKFLHQLKSEIKELEIRVVDGLIIKYRDLLLTLLEKFTEVSEQEIIADLNTGEIIDNIDIKQNITLNDVRICYFSEQKTLTYYKKLDTYLTHHLT